jgi:hypothetical protein
MPRKSRKHPPDEPVTLEELVSNFPEALSRLLSALVLWLIDQF